MQDRNAEALETMAGKIDAAMLWVVFKHEFVSGQERGADIYAELRGARDFFRLLSMYVKEYGAGQPSKTAAPVAFAAPFPRLLSFHATLFGPLQAPFGNLQATFQVFGLVLTLLGGSKRFCLRIKFRRRVIEEVVGKFGHQISLLPGWRTSGVMHNDQRVPGEQV